MCANIRHASTSGRGRWRRRGSGSPSSTANTKSFLRRAEETVTGGAKAHPKDVGRRSLERRRAEKKNLKPPPTLREEVRRHAEAEIERIADKYPNEPAIQRFRAIQAERDHLREALNIEERTINPEGLPEPDYGMRTITESRPRRVHVPGRPPARGSGRLVGGEDVRRPAARYYPHVPPRGENLRLRRAAASELAADGFDVVVIRIEEECCVVEASLLGAVMLADARSADA